MSVGVSVGVGVGVSVGVGVGLSVGVAQHLPEPGQYALTALMYIGRVGPLTLGSAIALNTRRRRYRYPEEQPIVG